MAKRSVAVGDAVIVYHPNQLDLPVAGKVVAITATPGKIVGVEFKEPVGVHDCDGCGKAKHCLWVHPQHLISKEEADAIVAAAKAPAKPAAVAKPLTLEIDDAGFVVK